jgi:hypothetical protein
MAFFFHNFFIAEAEMEQDENHINAPMREDEAKESDRRPITTQSSSVPDRRMRVMDVVNYSGLGSWGLPKEGPETDNADAFHNFVGKIREKLLADTLPAVRNPLYFILPKAGVRINAHKNSFFNVFSAEEGKKKILRKSLARVAGD